jgi:hypothetical protein
LLEVLLFLFVSLDPGHQVLEVGRGELPSEGPGGRVVAVLEGGESVFDLVKAGDTSARPSTCSPPPRTTCTPR